MLRLAHPALLLAALALCGLVVESDPDDSSARRPARDPGWANVGLRGGTSAVYLGRGWVITAGHSAAGEVVLGGVTHAAVPESTVTLAADGTLPADLIVFRIEPPPRLPRLRLRSTPPSVGEPVLMVGAGRGRGERATWQGHRGWSWGAGATLRWGTNRVFAVGLDVRAGGNLTPAFAMRFDAGETRLEAQAATGDSGGAVFIPRDGHFELAGVLIAIAEYPGQPPATSLLGNFSTAADLSAFRPTLMKLLDGD
jgi:hypothetical protein